MTITIYGFARVSTEGQSLTAQVAELKAAGCRRDATDEMDIARSYNVGHSTISRLR